MEKKAFLICCFVGFLGLLSAVLGFAAEGTRIKANNVVRRASGDCIYPKSPALYLGLASAVIVAIAQGVINFVAGCICCKRKSSRSNSKWTAALISFTLSWVAFIIAFLLLLTGAALNDRRGMEKMYLGDYCYVVKAGVFSVGAVLTLASVCLGILYYAALQAPKSAHHPWDPPRNQGVAMGQPQFPPHSTQPVFVHEDTYRRQQIP